MERYDCRDNRFSGALNRTYTRTYVIHVTHYLWTMRALCNIRIYDPSRIRWPLYKTKAHHGPIEFTAAASRHCSGGNDGLIKKTVAEEKERTENEIEKEKQHITRGDSCGRAVPYSAAMTRPMYYVYGWSFTRHLRPLRAHQNRFQPLSGRSLAAENDRTSIRCRSRRRLRSVFCFDESGVRKGRVRKRHEFAPFHNTPTAKTVICAVFFNYWPIKGTLRVAFETILHLNV